MAAVKTNILEERPNFPSGFRADHSFHIIQTWIQLQLGLSSARDNQNMLEWPGMDSIAHQKHTP